MKSDLMTRLSKRPALLIGLVLLVWVPVKLTWEVRIQEDFKELRFGQLEINQDLRDQISQNAMLGILGGMRSLVANLFYLEVTNAWMDKNWTEAKKNILLSTTIQPRFVPFWDNGGWHMAYNAAADARKDAMIDSPDTRIENEKYWINEGKRIFERGATVNPETYELWARLADLHQQKLKDYRTAAEYYKKASEMEDSPLFYERFPAIMWGLAGEDEKAYQHWKMLWEKHKDSPPRPQIAKDKIETEIRQLEEKLNVPVEKRVFPPEKPSPNLSVH